MATPPPSTLTRREREIMDVLFQRGEATAQQVLEGLAEPPSYSAVRALLRLLEERGHITHAQDGPRYVYRPVQGRQEARRSALMHVVKTFFEGSAEQAIANLVETSAKKMSRDEFERLEKLIAQAKKAGR